MSIKETWLGHCQELRRIIDDQAVPYGDEVSDRLSKLSESIRDYEFKVYLVGPFSCGKSTLLNTWLGVDLLPKGIAPETAVATELHYSASEKTVAYPFGDGDGLGNPVEIPGVGLEQMRKVTEMANDGKLARVCLYIDNAKLKENADVCLVDLPGLSSACKAHELAINQFLLEKSAGIFCVSMPSGTVTQEALEFLQDMDRYRASFDLLLTKADESTESDREATKKHVSETIKNRLGIPDEEFHVGVVSKQNVDDFSNLLNGLKTKREEFFCERYKAALLSICNDMLFPLQEALSDDFDVGSAQKKIEELKAAESKLAGICESASSEISEKVPDAVDRVVNAVKDALQEKVDSWFRQMKSGGDCNSDINATIKRTIALQAKDELSDIFDSASRRVSREFGKCLTFNIGDVQLGVFEGVSGKLSSGLDVIRSTSVGLSAGMVVGGVLGGTIGAFFGPAGAAAGAKIGTIVGGLVGAFDGVSSKIAENDRIRADLSEKLDAAGEQSRDSIIKLLNEAIDEFKKNMKTAMEEKVRSWRQQMVDLQSEAEKNKELFMKNKSSWQSAMNVVNGIITKVEVA
jgi:GTP-binding protein EngB required for normal cell division